MAGSNIFSDQVNCPSLAPSTSVYMSCMRNKSTRILQQVLEGSELHKKSWLGIINCVCPILSSTHCAACMHAIMCSVEQDFLHVNNMYVHADIARTVAP